MRFITNEELSLVSGGDRWGDGQDEKNHPAPSAPEPGLGHVEGFGFGAVVVRAGIVILEFLTMW